MRKIHRRKTDGICFFFLLFGSFLANWRSRKAEIQALSGPNEFTEFYARLKKIDQYYTNNQSEEVRENFSTFHRWSNQVKDETNLFQTAIPMSIEYEQMMKQLQETEDGEPIGNLSIHRIEQCFYDRCFVSSSGQFHRRRRLRTIHRSTSMSSCLFEC